MPSKSESFGRVYIEALANKNCVIASKNTGIDGLFSNKEVLYSEDSFENFLTKFRDVVNKTNCRKKLAKNSFEKVKKEFTWDKIIEKYIDLYT